MLRCHARRLLYLESPSESNPFAPTPFYFFLFFFFSFPFSPVAGKFFFFHSNFEFRVTHETFTWPRLRCLRRTTTYVTEIENLLFSVSPSLSVFTLTTVFPVKKKKNKKKEENKKGEKNRLIVSLRNCSVIKLTDRSSVSLGRRPLLILFRKRQPQIARYTAHLRERLICRN